MRTFDLRLFADYFQFYLQDESTEMQATEWSDEAVKRLLEVGNGIINVGTVRNMTVPITIEIRDAIEDESLDPWDQVNECSIHISSGKLVVAGCTDYFPDALRIELPPGPYRARIYYANLESLSENGLEGDDRYKVVLWPKPLGELIVLKQRHHCFVAQTTGGADCFEAATHRPRGELTRSELRVHCPLMIQRKSACL